MPDIRWTDNLKQEHTSYRYAMFTHNGAKYVVVYDILIHDFVVLHETEFETVGGKGVRPTPPSHRIK